MRPKYYINLNNILMNLDLDTEVDDLDKDDFIQELFINNPKENNIKVLNYDNPNLQKSKNTKTQSIYTAMINTNLLADKQYIVITCLRDNNKLGIICIVHISNHFLIP